MVIMEVSQIYYLQDYALTSCLLNQENLVVKFPGLLNQFGVVEQDYKTRMIMDVIMRRVRISIYMMSSCILQRKLSELKAYFSRKRQSSYQRKWISLPALVGFQRTDHARLIQCFPELGVGVTRTRECYRYIFFVV